MRPYLCHEQPDLLVHDALVLDARPGAVRVSRSALHPGGGGQECDLGTIEHRHGVMAITGIDLDGDGAVDGEPWLLLEEPVVLDGEVVVRVDAERRSVLAQLHTDSHLLNALAFERFAGALVTGAQISADGTARMDLDLPGVDNDLLRKIDADINAVIARQVAVNAYYVPVAAAETEPGLLRSKSVAPPPTDSGEFRVIDIVGVDRQACGGTHLSNTGQSRPVVVTKVENKGRHNRRVRFRLS